MKNLLFIICCVLVGISVQAQTIESLNEEIRRAEEEIEATNKLLKSNESKTVSSEKELKLVRNNISQRRSIIKNLNRQSTKINTNVRNKSRSIGNLEKEIEALEEEEATLNLSLADPAVTGNFALLNEKCKRLEEVRTKVEALYEEYETLL
jgi:ATP-binding cassette subfamily F protein 3